MLGKTDQELAEFELVSEAKVQHWLNHPAHEVPHRKHLTVERIRELAALAGVAAPGHKKATLGSAQPGAGKTYNAPYHWIDGDELVKWPDNPYWYREWSPERQKAFGVNNLRLCAEVSELTGVPVMICADLQALDTFIKTYEGSFFVWVPPEEYVRKGLEAREKAGRPGNPTFEESMNYLKGLLKMAEHYGFDLVHGDHHAAHEYVHTRCWESKRDLRFGEAHKDLKKQPYLLDGVAQDLARMEKRTYHASDSDDLDDFEEDSDTYAFERREQKRFKALLKEAGYNPRP